MGDDAMMLGFLHGLKERHNVTVLSGAPEQTQYLYSIESVARRDMKAVEVAIQKCDALVFPGGSIFQDSTSVFSVKHYGGLVAMAKKANKKVLLLGQGVGPLNSFFGKKMASTAFNAADVITVRDPGSLAALKELGVKKNVKVTADCAFLLPGPHEESSAESFGVGNMRVVGVSARPLDKKTDVPALFGEFCKLLYQSGTMPVLIEMDHEEDRGLIDAISKRQGGKIPDLRKLQTPMQVQERLRRMEAVVAMRLHAGILAATVGVPPLMVSYDPKVAAFGKLLELAPPLSMEGLTPTRMFDAFVAFMKDRDRHAKILDKKRVEMVGLAQQNIEVVLDAVRA